MGSVLPAPVARARVRVTATMEMAGLARIHRRLLTTVAFLAKGLVLVVLGNWSWLEIVWKGSGERLEGVLP